MTARVRSILDEGPGWPPVIRLVRVALEDAPLASPHGRHRLDFRRFADPVNTVTVRELAPWLPRRRWFAPWLVFTAYAVWVPLLLATMAVLAGCVPEDGGTGPVRQVLPEVSTDSPRSWIVPDGGGR